MIAAIASGVLGQVEGALSASGGLSAITDLLTTAPAAATSPTQAASAIGQLAHGHGHRGGGLSDQLQSVLLQQQSVDGPTAIEDDTTGSDAIVNATEGAQAGTFSG